MWKELQKSPGYYIFVDKVQRYNILITDYIRIWEVCHSEEELHTHLKKSNFGLEMDNSELLDKGLQMLKNPTKLKSIKIFTEEKILTVSMSMSFSFPLKLTLNLLEGSQELFFQKITQPALKSIQDLRISESELRKLLITKDDEIEEYKSFGGKIRYTAIPPYNDKVHMEKHCAYNDYFGDDEVPLNVLSKVIDIPKEACFVKEEIIDDKVSVKLEPESQTSTQMKDIDIKHNIKNETSKSQPARKRRLNL